MAGYNKIILMGNLTRDPQLSYLPSETPVCEIGLAVNRKYKTQDGQQKEDVCFVDCRAFGKRAETLNQYMKKGDPLLVEGRLEFDQWEDQQGNKRSKHRVFVETFSFVGGVQQGQQSRPQNQQQGNQMPPQPSGGYNPKDFSGPEEDIPF